MVAPRVPLVDDPGRQAERRIAQPLAKRLRLRRLDLLISEVRRRRGGGAVAAGRRWWRGRQSLRGIQPGAMPRCASCRQAPGRWRLRCPSRCRGRCSGCSRDAPSASPRPGPSVRGRTRAPAACPRSRSRASTARRHERRVPVPAARLRRVVSGSITLSYSTGELGHPFRSSSGRASASLRLLMNEMDVEAADVRLELAEAVQPPLLRAPVVAVAPVGHQRLDVIEVRPVVPAGVGEFVGETGALQPALEVAQDGVRHLDAERHNRIAPARCRWARWSLRVQASRQNGAAAAARMMFAATVPMPMPPPIMLVAH